MKTWDGEKQALERFARSLASIPPLPDASEYELEVHAVQTARLTDLLTLVVALPKKGRPPVREWDKILGPLFFQLYLKGDDIDRYILADIWRKVLLEEGEVDGYLRACAAVAASARNFYRFEEALEICRQGRVVAAKRISPALANLVNVEGIVQECRGDFDAAEGAFREAMLLADALPEKDFATWTRVPKANFRNRVHLNTMDTYLHRGYVTVGIERARSAAMARSFIEEIEHEPLSDAHRNLLLVNSAELAIVEGKLKFAKTLLMPLMTRGPGKTEASINYSAAHARLLSLIATMEGHYETGYRWIRIALKEGIRNSIVGEEQFILEQAFKVLHGLYRTGSTHGTHGLVHDLVQLLEDKDWYTGRSHSRGVSRLAVRLGETLNAGNGSSLDIKTLETAALLHDIGKLRVPWSLLNKIGPLTPKEWGLLRDHSTHGGDILNRIAMVDLAPTVAGHHEHMDGSGYPSGQRPDLMAAIVGVSDAFEAATTSTRRYKVPKSKQTVLKELTAGSGTRYHPDVVKALKAVVAKEATI